MSKSPKNMKKLLPKRKPERKPSEEDFTVRKSKYSSAMVAQPEHQKMCFKPFWSKNKVLHCFYLFKNIEYHSNTMSNNI